MGGFAGFSQGLTSVLRPELERRRRVQEEKDRAIRDHWFDVASNTDQSAVSPELWDQAQTELAKHMPDKDSKGHLQKFLGFIKQAREHPANTQPSPRNAVAPPAVADTQDQEAISPEQAATFAPVAPPAVPISAPKQSAATFMGMSQGARKTRQEAAVSLKEAGPEAAAAGRLAVEKQRGENRLKELNKKLDSTGGKILNKEIKTIGEDGKPHSFTSILGKDGEIEYFDNGPLPPDTKLGAAPRPGGQMLTVENAQSMQNSGASINGPGGQPLDLSKLPKGMMLQPWGLSGGQLMYMPFDPKNQKYVIGNVAYAANAWELPHLAEGQGTNLGVQNPGTSSTRESYEFGDTTHRSNPAPGVTGRPVASGFPTPMATQPTPAAVVPTPAPVVPKPSQPPAKQPINPLVEGNSFNTIPEDRSAGRITNPKLVSQQMRYRPAMMALTQFAGDPRTPNQGSSEDIIKIMDKPEQVEKFAKAWTIVTQEIDKIEHSQPGLWSMIQSQTGMPAVQAAALSKIRTDALNSLNDFPDAKKALNYAIAQQAVMPGLRSATGAPATEGSMKKLRPELIIPGITVTQKSEAYQKLEKLTQEAYTAIKDASPMSIDSRDGQKLKQYYRNKIDDYHKKYQDALAQESGRRVGSPGSKTGKRPSLEDIFK